MIKVLAKENFREGNFIESKKLFRKGIRLNQQQEKIDPFLYLNLSMLYLRLSDYWSAI